LILICVQSVVHVLMFVLTRQSAFLNKEYSKKIQRRHWCRFFLLYILNNGIIPTVTSIVVVQVNLMFLLSFARNLNNIGCSRHNIQVNLMFLLSFARNLNNIGCARHNIQVNLMFLLSFARNFLSVRQKKQARCFRFLTCFA
jgi:hypothetical protein